MHRDVSRTAMNFQDKIPLDEGTKSIYKNIIINSQWSNSRLINTSKLNYPLSFQIFMAL